MDGGRKRRPYGSKVFNQQIEGRARKALGLRQGQGMDLAMLDYIRAVAVELGHTPAMREVLGGHYIARRFCDWGVALLMAGLPMENVKKPSRHAFRDYTRRCAKARPKKDNTNHTRVEQTAPVATAGDRPAKKKAISRDTLELISLILGVILFYRVGQYFEHRAVENAAAIRALKELGVRTAMLTGDGEASARAVAQPRCASPGLRMWIISTVPPQKTASTATPASAAFPPLSWSAAAAACCGCWHPFKRVGDPVCEGETLGEIRDLFGARLCEVKAKMEGTILIRTVSLGIEAGTPMIAYGGKGQ